MPVTIELLSNVFFEIEFSFPLIGHHRYKWANPNETSYGVLHGDTGAVIKKGFNTYQQAESWATQENFSIV